MALVAVSLGSHIASAGFSFVVADQAAVSIVCGWDCMGQSPVLPVAGGLFLRMALGAEFIFPGVLDGKVVAAGPFNHLLGHGHLMALVTLIDILQGQLPVLGHKHRVSVALRLDELGVAGLAVIEFRPGALLSMAFQAVLHGELQEVMLHVSLAHGLYPFVPVAVGGEPILANVSVGYGAVAPDAGNLFIFVYLVRYFYVPAGCRDPVLGMAPLANFVFYRHFSDDWRVYPACKVVIKLL